MLKVTLAPRFRVFENFLQLAGLFSSFPVSSLLGFPRRAIVACDARLLPISTANEIERSLSPTLDVLKSNALWPNLKIKQTSKALDL